MSNLPIAANMKIVDKASGRTAEMHTSVRQVLKHHKLTVHGDGVLEADLIEAVLKHLTPEFISWVTQRNNNGTSD